MTTDFTVIRHGQTAENLAGLLQGHWDTGLDELGIRQSECAAARLRDEKFDRIFSSDLKRAMQTAVIIAGVQGQAVIPLAALREWHLGELEMQPCAELRKEYPEIMDAFCHESGDFPVPGGESHGAFCRRVTECLEDLAEQYAGQKLLLVTHGGTLRAIFRHIVGAVADRALLPVTSNASYGRFCHRDGKWQLRCWNDVSHLAKTGVRDSFTF